MHLGRIPTPEPSQVLLPVYLSVPVTYRSTYLPGIYGIQFSRLYLREIALQRA